MNVTLVNASIVLVHLKAPEETLVLH